MPNLNHYEVKYNRPPKSIHGRAGLHSADIQTGFISGKPLVGCAGPAGALAGRSCCPAEMAMGALRRRLAATATAALPRCRHVSSLNPCLPPAPHPTTLPPRPRTPRPRALGWGRAPRRHLAYHPQDDLGQLADHYQTLGVARDSDLSAIRASYTQLVRQLHPDTAEGDEAEQGADARAAFDAVVEAYGVLSDAAKRRAYDELLLQATADWLDQQLRSATVADAMNFQRRSRRSVAIELLATPRAAAILSADPLAVTAETWGELLGCCEQWRHVRVALNVWELARQHNIHTGFGPQACNIVFRMLLQVRQHDEARALWAEMGALGIEPDLRNANAVRQFRNYREWMLQAAPAAADSAREAEEPPPGWAQGTTRH